MTSQLWNLGWHFIWICNCCWCYCSWDWSHSSWNYSEKTSCNVVFSIFPALAFGSEPVLEPRPASNLSHVLLTPIISMKLAFSSASIHCPPGLSRGLSKRPSVCRNCVYIITSSKPNHRPTHPYACLTPGSFVAEILWDLKTPWASKISAKVISSFWNLVCTAHPFSKLLQRLSLFALRFLAWRGRQFNQFHVWIPGSISKQNSCSCLVSPVLSCQDSNSISSAASSWTLFEIWYAWWLWSSSCCCQVEVLAIGAHLWIFA